ncbi:MAG: hypothetical protein LPK07_14300 [Hymenobacteraceae bacterium]|nr:hypothetical protein [Hymenobacteraceae bacterium]MDX5482847.1 hypothetical protein [Hymenobacteraceae bacterium]
MKHYSLLFLSTLLFLFTLAQPGKQVNGLACAKKSELKAAAVYKKHKRPCAKKCLRHRTHSEQKNDANVTVDCGHQLYAVVSDTQPETPFKSGVGRQLMASAQRKHHAPDLGSDPDPPRFS